jgi:hypothetical protein
VCVCAPRDPRTHKIPITTNDDDSKYDAPTQKGTYKNARNDELFLIFYLPDSETYIQITEKGVEGATPKSRLGLSNA